LGIKSKTLKSFVVVIVVVQYGNKYLLLKRTSKRRFFPDKWQTVSGFIKEYESVEEAAHREMKEETGLKGEIIKFGKIFITLTDKERWINILILVKTKSNKVQIDPKEHTQYIWIKEKKDLDNLELVKGVDKDFKYLDIF
jgi:ADP-ribose pyrophosphatase YjhB (NUDIX family)